MANRITIKDIAEMAQTSKTTVSYYLNGKFDKMSEKTREQIRQVIEKTHYRPNMMARSLNDKGTKLIGVLIGDITNSFANQILKGIEDVASAKGYHVMVGSSNYVKEKESNYIDSMMLLGIDGFIIQPTSHFHKYSSMIADQNKPMVFFDSQLYDHKTRWVKTNNYDATYTAVCQCIEKGYEEFLLIGADPTLLTTRIERTKGFVDALEDHALSFEHLMIQNEKENPEHISVFLQHHISKDKKTLIFVPNCWALPLVFHQVKQLGLKMPQVGIMGFDNTEWTNFSSPTITTIVQPAFEEGQQAAKILIDQIEDINEQQPQQVLDCTINWNESTQL